MNFSAPPPTQHFRAAIFADIETEDGLWQSAELDGCEITLKKPSAKASCAALSSPVRDATG